jgi:outer membrane protein OmpA-like peptidoglycan-associated protein
MTLSRSFIRKLVLALFGLFLLYALVGWLAVPRIVRSEAGQYVLEKTGCRLSLGLPKFNPFTFDIDIPNVRLDDAAGKRLMAIAEVDANLDVLKRGLAFDSVRLEKPEADIVLKKSGKSNWSEFLEKISGGTNHSGSPTRLYFARFHLEGGGIDFRDERNNFHERIEPVQLNLKDVSTSPGEQGSFRLAARTDSGIGFSWQGATDLSKASGKLVLDNLDSRPIAAYVKGIPSFEKGMLAANVTVSYAEGKIGLNLEGLQVKAERISSKSLLYIQAVEAKDGSFDLNKEKLSFGQLSASRGKIGKYVEMDALMIGDMRADISGRSVSAGRIAIEKGSVNLVRNKNGNLDIPGAMNSPGKSDASPWHYHVGKFDLSGFSVKFQDESVSPDAHLGLKNISFKASGISDAPAVSVPFQASMQGTQGGMLDADGRFTPSGKSADVNLKIRGLSLSPAQPYLSSFARLTIASGKLGASGHATYDGKGARYAGSFSINDLRLLEKGKRVFLSWKSLSTRSLKVDRSKLAIAALEIDRPYAKLIISRNRSVNLSRVLKKREAASKPGANFPIDIGRIRIRRGEMDYADHSLALPFGTRIHRLHGFVNGISSSPGTIGQLQLRGRVNTYGSFDAAGQLNLFDPTALTDIKVKFRNIEMARLTPYSATFVGRKITSGKLSLDLDYKIKNRQLTGDNQIIMDNLTLGDRVKSREAKDLPLDLAIAVLQDADGRIDLGLPVSGSLDSPQFSYGGIIWEAFLKVIGKIVTSPFRMLSALFGGTQERFANIAFEPGSSALLPPEQEKVANLANAMERRPGLLLTVHGVYSDADRVALQDLEARRAVAALHGGEPGPLVLSFPGTREAIEKLFAKKFGSAELAAMKAGFRKVNPGKMKEGLVERVEGIFRKPRKLGEKETAAMKGTDFDEVLYKRLRDAEVVPESALIGLGKARGEAIYSILNASGAPPDRVRLASPVHVEGAGENVPAKLELAPAVK